jgi:hypothetical protein
MTDQELIIEGWKDLHKRLPTFTEEELRQIINYEVSTYKRKDILTRLHMRFTKLNNKSMREKLLNGEALL